MTNAKETLAMFNDFGTKGYETARELGEINLRAMERLMARQMDAVSLVMESGVRLSKLATEARGYNELVKSQVELGREISERLMEEGRENVKLATETRDEYRGWLEQNLASLNERVSKATAQAAI